MDTLLQAINLGKKFARNEKASNREIRRRVFQSLFSYPKGGIENDESEHVWALRGIDIILKRGETLGVIGRNGAGKSTLLNLLAGHHAADEGSVELKGRVVSLINLSTGMNGNLSGRQNIFQKGLLNGLSEEEIRTKEDSIIDFAELGHCIDSPYKTYSSGMKMRLAFSINTHSEADVIIVDEVLSVGDFEFRQKCHGWLQAIRPNVAFVLVTHSMSDLSRFCNRAILLEKGNLLFEGDAQSCIAAYNKNTNAVGLAKRNDQRSQFSTLHVWGGARSFEAGTASFAELVGEDSMTIATSQGVSFVVKTFLAKRLDNPTMGINIINSSGQIVLNFNSERLLLDSFFEQLYIKPCSFTVSLKAPRLWPGKYFVVIVFTSGIEIIHRNKILDLFVMDPKEKSIPFYGLVDGDWSLAIDGQNQII